MLSALPPSYLSRHTVPGGWNVLDVSEELTFVAVPVVGCVLGSRRPANKIGWVFLAIGLLLGLGFFCQRYGIYGLLAARSGLMPAVTAAPLAHPGRNS